MAETTPIVVERHPDSGEGGVYLVQIHGDPIGRLINVIGEVTMGRDDDNDVVLDHSSVSRYHARVTRRDDRCWVEDLGSTNGTAVNEHLVIEQTTLYNGDRIRVGGVWFRCISGDRLEQRYHEEIHRLVVADGLTGLHNRRHFDDFLEREIARSSRRGTPLSVALIDIDHFKNVNDKLGHLVGDEVLRGVADRLSHRMRREELIARFGGEEFAVIYPDTTLNEAIDGCERLRQAVAAEPIVSGDERISVTVSIGVASTIGNKRIGEILSEADTRLYEAKSAGRNVVLPRPMPASPNDGALDSRDNST